MLQTAFSAVDSRVARVSVNAGLPFSIAPSTRSNLPWSQVLVPSDEMWIITSAGGGVQVDNSLVTVSLTCCSVRSDPPARVTFNEFFGAGAFTSFGSMVPVSTFNFTANLNHRFGVSLQGVELYPNQRLSLFMEVNNADAVTTRNVTAAGFEINYKPIKLVSEQAVSILAAQREDSFLNQRLVQRR